MFLGILAARAALGYSDPRALCTPTHEEKMTKEFFQRSNFKARTTRQQAIPRLSARYTSTTRTPRASPIGTRPPTTTRSATNSELRKKYKWQMALPRKRKRNFTRHRPRRSPKNAPYHGWSLASLLPPVLFLLPKSSGASLLLFT